MIISNFLIISCIGKDDKLGLRINKDFFIKKFEVKKDYNEKLVYEILKFLKSHNLRIDEKFSVIVNQGQEAFRSENIASCGKGSRNFEKSQIVRL